MHYILLSPLSRMNLILMGHLSFGIMYHRSEGEPDIMIVIKSCIICTCTMNTGTGPIFFWTRFWCINFLGYWKGQRSWPLHTKHVQMTYSWTRIVYCYSWPPNVTWPVNIFMESCTSYCLSCLMDMNPQVQPTSYTLLGGLNYRRMSPSAYNTTSTFRVRRTVKTWCFSQLVLPQVTKIHVQYTPSRRLIGLRENSDQKPKWEKLFSNISVCW